MPPGQFQSNGREEGPRAEPDRSGKHSYHGDTESGGRARDGYWMTVGLPLRFKVGEGYA